MRTIEKTGNELLSDIVRMHRGSSMGISLRHNPVVNTLQVSFDIPAHGNTSFSILNLQGQELENGTIASGTTRFNYPVGKLAKGSYFFIVHTTAGRQQIKFIVK